MMQIVEGGLDVPVVGSGYNRLIYTKGALVVQTLRLELGDSLFFKTLQNFISRCHNKNARWKDLCRIAEGISGRNLGYFFEQWLLRPGLPNLDLEYETIPKGKAFEIKGKVIQSGSVYRLSSKLEISGQRLKDAHELLLDETETTFAYLVSFKPETVDLNVGEGVPCIIRGSGLSVKKAKLESAGNKALNNHDYEKAIVNYAELLKLPLENGEKGLASYQIGKTLFGLKKYPEAEEQFKRALSYGELALDYRYAAVLYQGKSSLCAGKRGLAQEYFRQLVSLPDVPEYYKAEASRLSQYLGLVTPPPEETIRLVQGLEEAINEKNVAELKILGERLPEDKKASIEIFGKIPILNFELKIELILAASDDGYYVECYATGTLGERILSGDFIILTQQVKKEAKLIDVIRIQMN
jgi:tetratricopeptide (TPR) repeat protein